MFEEHSKGPAATHQLRLRWQSVPILEKPWRMKHIRGIENQPLPLPNMLVMQASRDSAMLMGRTVGNGAMTLWIKLT